mmetsp:Transcript_23903/g.39538  ORF Transcript_23903/g.39538 Transcript_23903/m.39538 type:complete len:80 (-) Transcript_23903:272-511(-)
MQHAASSPPACISHHQLTTKGVTNESIRLSLIDTFHNTSLGGIQQQYLICILLTRVSQNKQPTRAILKINSTNLLRQII